MTGARLTRLKRKLDRWLWARQALLERSDAYRYLYRRGGVLDRIERRMLSEDEVLELPGLDLWEERIA